MPEAELAARGGYTRVRTQRLPGGKYRRVFIVREAGPHGGHTVAGPTRKRKGDAAPKYKMKPDPIKPRPIRRKRRAEK